MGDVKPSGKERGAIDQLSQKVVDLTKSLDENSQSSNNLQEKLIFWTKVMAGAVVIQAIAIAVQIYLTFFN